MKSYILIIGLVVLGSLACTSKTTVTSSSNKTAGNEANSEVATGQIKTKGSITFKAANDRYNAEGKFNNWYFTSVSIVDNKLESLKGSIVVDLASISEKSDGLTNHLKSPDFFNVSKYSSANIFISKIKKTAQFEYQANLNLEMKGLTQDILSDVVVISESPLTIKGTAKVDRILFGLGDESLGVPQYVLVEFETEIPQ